LASPVIEENQTPNSNCLFTLNDSECEIKEAIISKNDNYEYSKLRKINTFEIKIKNKKSHINNERKLNTCNSLSTKNTNFAKYKHENQDFKINMLDNTQGNLLISKKQPIAITEQANSNKNPLNNLILHKRNSKINYKFNSLLKEDSGITEIKTEENASTNNLKAYKVKTRNNAVILEEANGNFLINECDDLDESASFIDFNFINNNNNYNANNNSIVKSFNESRRKNGPRNSFNNQLKFDSLLKMHDYSNSNLMQINTIKGLDYQLNENLFDNFNKKNLDKNKNKEFLNENLNKDFGLYNNKEKGQVFCSFSNDYNNKINDNSIINNKNLLEENFSNLHLSEFKDCKENFKAINSNISRLNTHKSESSKNTSNINFYRNTTNSILIPKEKRKFLKNSFLNILTFLKGKDIKSLYYSFKKMKLLIIDSLMMEVNRKLLNVFKINCGNFLDLLSKKLTFKKNNSNIFLYKKNVFIYFICRRKFNY